MTTCNSKVIQGTSSAKEGKRDLQLFKQQSAFNVSRKASKEKPLCVLRLSMYQILVGNESAGSDHLIPRTIPALSEIS